MPFLIDANRGTPIAILCMCVGGAHEFSLPGHVSDSEHDIGSARVKDSAKKMRLLTLYSTKATLNSGGRIVRIAYL